MSDCDRGQVNSIQHRRMAYICYLLGLDEGHHLLKLLDQLFQEYLLSDRKIDLRDLENI